MTTATLPRSNRETLLERVLAAPGRVDRAAGIIYGVKALGRKSKNNREYSDQALREAVRFYEGIAVRINHPDKNKPGADRQFHEHFGCLRNAVLRDGVFADLHFLPSHGQANVVCEAAERMPHTFGLSHNAEGRTTTRGGKTIVESILSVRSVDIVCNPATTSGLFESVDRAIARIARLPRSQVLTESAALRAEIDRLSLAVLRNSGKTTKARHALLDELAAMSARLDEIEKDLDVIPLPTDDEDDDEPIVTAESLPYILKGLQPPSTALTESTKAFLRAITR